MNVLGTLGTGAMKGGMVFSGVWSNSESCSDEMVSFINEFLSSMSGRVNVSSIGRLNGWGFAEKGGERGSGTFEAAHGEELKRGINFRAERAAVRRGDWGLLIEDASSTTDRITMSLLALPVSEMSFSSYAGERRLEGS